MLAVAPPLVEGTNCGVSLRTSLDIDRAGELDIVRVDHRDRGRGVEAFARDARAGDEQRLLLLGTARGRSWFILRDCAAGSAQGNADRRQLATAQKAGTPPLETTLAHSSPSQPVF